MRPFTTKLSLFPALSALFLTTLVGCGGNVVVDNSSGGAGGGGGNGGTTNSTTTTSTTTTVDPPTFCESICSTAAQYGCLGGGSIAECAQGCVELFKQYPSCAVETKDLYQCAVDQFPQTGCNGGGEQVCQKESEAFAKCTGGTGTCGSDGCGGSGNDCFCTGTCNNHSLEADCKTGANGSVECVCFVDGGQVATCNDVDLSCDLFNGCCSAFFPF